MTLGLSAGRALIGAVAGSTRFDLARIQAPTARGDSERIPVSLAFVLSRFGSMGGEKIRLARDRFGVGTSDDRLWLPRARRPLHGLLAAIVQRDDQAL